MAIQGSVQSYVVVSVPSSAAIALLPLSPLLWGPYTGTLPSVPDYFCTKCMATCFSIHVMEMWPCHPYKSLRWGWGSRSPLPLLLSRVTVPASRATCQTEQDDELCSTMRAVSRAWKVAVVLTSKEERLETWYFSI